MLAQLKKALKARSWDPARLWGLMDEDRSNVVSPAEFQEGILKFGQGRLFVEEREREALWSVFNADGDGRITWQEFGGALSAKGPKKKKKGKAKKGKAKKERKKGLPAFYAYMEAAQLVRSRATYACSYARPRNLLDIPVRTSARIPPPPSPPAQASCAPARRRAQRHWRVAKYVAVGALMWWRSKETEMMLAKQVRPP